MLFLRMKLCKPTHFLRIGKTDKKNPGRFVLFPEDVFIPNIFLLPTIVRGSAIPGNVFSKFFQIQLTFAAIFPQL